MIRPQRLWPFYSEKAVADATSLIRRGETYASASHTKISELEANFLATHGDYNRQALFVGSGTAALLAGYYALDLPFGSEILVPVQTFHATVSPLLWLGLQPVMCDCDPATGLIDLPDAAKRVTRRTRALVITHLWGQLVDVGEARKLCDEHGLILVEDCSHAHGAQESGIIRLADVSAYSLGTKKIVSGGVGGILITHAGRMMERAALLTQSPLRAQELIPKASEVADFVGSGVGLNLRGSPLAALLANDHVTRLDEITGRKNELLGQIRQLILEHLSDVDVPEIPLSGHRTLYALPMKVSGGCEVGALKRRRDRLVHLLSAAGFRATASPRGLNTLPLFRRPGIVPGARQARAHGRMGWPGSDSVSATSLRLDTRNMYDPWSKSDLAIARAEMVQISRDLNGEL